MTKDEFKEIFISLFYPRRCPVCGEVVPIGKYFHSECEKKIIKVTPGCEKCGKPVARGHICGDCAGNPHVYTEGRGLFLYEGPVRESISALKYLGKREYGEAIGKLMYRYGQKYIGRWKPEVIIPVPVHRDRKRERGYNQAEVLAREISKSSGIPLGKDIIVRIKNTEALKKLDPEGRKEQVRSAFGAGAAKSLAAGTKRAMIVDDIYTTGATIDGCASVLKGLGVDKVYFLTACIGKDKSS